MAQIVIGDHTVLFDDDFEQEVVGHSWSVSKVRNKFYVRSGQRFMHRVVLGASKGQIIDHINGDGLDNRRCNLRIASHQMNRLNTSSPKKKSKYYGVTSSGRKKNPWCGMAKDSGRVVHLGNFSTEAEAAIAYDAHVKRLYGDLALTNFK
jgi:hypothetical protein